MTVQVDNVTAHPVLTLSVAKSDANETFRRFITTAGARAGAGARALGVPRVRSKEMGELVPVDVAGVILVEAGAAVAVDAQVTPDGDGKAVTAAGANVVGGRALLAAAEDGDVIPILRALT